MFFVKVIKNIKVIYQEIIESVVCCVGFVIEVYDIEGILEKRLVVVFCLRIVRGIFSVLSDFYYYYGVISFCKYVEQFFNGIIIISIYL